MTGHNNSNKNNTLRGFLKRANNLPNHIQDELQVQVFYLLKQEEEKNEKISQLKNILEQEGYIKNNIVNIGKLKDFHISASIQTQLTKFYTKYYPEDNTTEFPKYIRTLQVIKAKFDELSYSQEIISSSEQEKKRKIEKIQNVYHYLETEGLFSEDASTITGTQIYSISSDDTFRSILEKFRDTYMSGTTWQDTLIYILGYKNIKIEKGAFDTKNQESIAMNIQINDFLKEHTIKRLNLKTERQKVSLSEANNLENEEGVLCILDGDVYRKISIERDMSFILRGKYGYSAERSIRQMNLDSIKLSDLGNTKVRPSKLANKNSLMHNRIQITIPSKVSYNNTIYQVNTNTVRSLKINDDTIIIYDNGYCFIIDMKHEGETISREGVQGFKNRARPYNPSDYIKQKKNEDQNDYIGRIMQYSNLSFLSDVYKSLLDNAYFNIQQYPLEEQIGFVTYYNSLGDKDKQTFQQLLKDNGDGIFKIFKICETEVGNGNLILQVYNTLGEKKCLPLLEKIIDIVNIINSLNTVESHGGDGDNFYHNILNKSVGLLQQVINHPEKDLDKQIDAINTQLLEHGMLFKSLKKKCYKFRGA